MREFLKKAFGFQKENQEKIEDWDFYSNIVKNLEVSREIISKNRDYFVANYNNLEFDRFICLTGEKDKKFCTIMVDRETGKIYLPKWFNEQVKKKIWFYKTGDTAIKYLENLSVRNIANWKAEYYSELDYLKKNGIFEWLDVGDYFSGWNDKLIYRHKNLRNYIAFPTSDYFALLDIWGDDFTTQKFIKFVKKHNFVIDGRINFEDNDEVSPKFQTVPKILKNLEKESGIVLYGNKISFPSSLFKNSSLISKYENFIEFIDFLLWKIELFTEKHHEEILKVSEIHNNISILEAKNSDLIKFNKLVLENVLFSFDPIEKILQKYRNEISEVLKDIENRTDSFFENSENSIFDFFPNIQDFDFNLIGETLTRKYNSKVSKIENMFQKLEEIGQLSESVKTIFLEANSFENAKKDTLKSICEKEYVLESFETIYSEWNFQTELIYKLYSVLFEKYFEKTISIDSTLYILTLLESLKTYNEDFFKNERISIIQKYDGFSNGTFLQKAEIETRLFKHFRDIRNGLKNAVESEERIIAKKFIHSQAELFFSFEIENILNFLKIAGVSEKLNKDFAELKNRNFEIHLINFETYEKAFEKRDRDLQSLLFKMKKELEITKLDTKKTNLIDS
jgi:hypothetical protein